MIAPKNPVADECARIPAQVCAFFQPGGVLARSGTGDAEGFAFEVRPQQAAMAEAVARAILEPEHLAVEAGTGVGKTFAYLVPLILLAKARQRPVAVSTYTINLQEQLVFKDIPFLQRHLGLDFKVALCKGRANYLCLRRLERARRAVGDLFNKAQERELARLRRWADETADGSLSDWTPGKEDEQEKQTPNIERPTPNAECRAMEGRRQTTELQSEINNQKSTMYLSLWSHVCSEHDNCLARKCPHYARCFLMKARARAFEADLLVLNHHLFFSDLALREAGKGLLPEFDTLVLDEAHRLEDTAGEHLGIRLSQGGFEHWLRRLYTPETRKGLLAALKETELAGEVGRMWEDVEQFFLEVQQWARLDGNKNTRRIVPEPLVFATLLGARQAKIARAVKRLAETVTDADLETELNAVARRGLEMAAALDVFLKQTADDHVYWVAREGARRLQWVLYSAPIAVAPILEQLLFEAYASIIMTSATLAVGGSEKQTPNAQCVKTYGGEENTKQTPDGAKHTASAQPRQARGKHAMPDNGSRKPAIGNQKSTIINTSNGLTPLGYFKQRIGAVRCRELVVGSPFNYTRQMRLYIAGDMPDPNDTAAFTAAASRAIRYFVKKTQGRAFVLFTSAEMMRAVARDLGPFFEEEGILPLVQGLGIPKHVMLERFRRAHDGRRTPDDGRRMPDDGLPSEARERRSGLPSDLSAVALAKVEALERRRDDGSAIRNQQSAISNSAVLFGLDSFWMGVDVRGEALSNVMIVRLPFAVPDEPVIKARLDRIKEQGGDPFREYSLPEAILKFRQGVGRLIRTATDEGIIVVLDSRIVSKWYGRLFLAAIPECPVEIVEACPP